MKFTGAEVLEATGGKFAAHGTAAADFGEVSTDTRTLRPGALFVALKGPHHDGHDHLEAAIRAGAAGVLIHRGEAPQGIPAVRVRDTLDALGALGRFVRRKLQFRVLAVTGSVGKTTTKEMAAALLRAEGIRILASPGNWNNRIGLPLSLVGARGDEDVAVLELGINEPGEMTHLTAVCEPDVAVITAVTECHTERLGSLAGVAREKLVITEGLRSDGVLVLPHSDSNLIPPPGLRVVTFGWENGADVRGESFAGLGPAGCRFRVGETLFHLSLPGRHNAENALAALAATQALGSAWRRAPEALSAIRPTALRGEIRSTPAGARLFVDCYNANPKAVEAALETLGELAGRARKIAVLGEMRELGPLSAIGHERMGRAVARLGVDELHLLGPATARTREVAVTEGLAPEKIWLHDDRVSLELTLEHHIRNGDWVLIKGSRALGLETLVETLEGRGARHEARE